MSEPSPEPTGTHPRRTWPKRTWLRRTLLALAAVFVLCAALILAIPPVVSSDWARAKVEQALASASGRPASLRLLSFSWADGLRVEGLLVGRGGLEDEAFVCSLELLHADLGFLSALRKDLRLTLRLSGLRLRQHIDMTATGAAKPAETAPAPPLPTLLRDSLASLRAGLKPTKSYWDAHLDVDLADMAVRLDLAEGNSTAKPTRLDLREAALRVQAPGLAKGPLRLDAGLKILLNGKELAPLALQASLDGLVDPAGLLTPAQAKLSAKAEAPGLSLLAQGSAAKGFKADLRLDVRQLTPLLKPFAGSTLPEASGALALGLTASQPDPDHLALALVAFADGLEAAGGPLGARSVGPLRLNLLQEASFDLAAGAVRLPGRLSLQGKSSMEWLGAATGLNEGSSKISLNIRPLHLQLDELLPAVRAWLPPGLGLGAATLDAEGLELTATLPEKAGDAPQLSASATGLRLEARDMTSASGAERLSLGRAALRLESVRAALPGQLEATASLELETLRLRGATPLTMKRAAISRLGLKIATLAQDPAALFGLSGAASLDMAAEVQGLDVPGKSLAPALTQTLALQAELPAAKTAQVRLESLGVDIPNLQLFQPGKRPLTAPLTLRLTAPDIRLGGAPTGLASIAEAKLALDIGSALHCAATASLSGGEVRSAGGLSLDMQKLLALAAPLLPPRAKGSGSLALDWNLAASLPQQKAPATKPEKLSQTLARLGFVKELEAVLKLSEVSLDWPLAPGGGTAPETLRLRGLTTPKPLRAASTAGMRESSLTGSLAFGPLAELPGVGPLSRPMRGLLTLNAAQQGLRSLQITQVLHTDSPELDQSLRVTLDRLDQVLDHDQDRLAAILEFVDGTVGFSIQTGLQSLPASLPAAGAKAAQGQADNRLSGKGRIEAGFDARLSAGRSLAVSARLLSPGLDLRLGPGLAVTGLTSSLNLSRRYSLSPGLRCAAPAGEVALPLSEQVFDLFPAATAGGGDFARATLHEFQSGGGGLGFSQLKLKSGPLPLSVHDVFLRLDTGGPLPALRSFRAGLLGGNIKGSTLLKGARGSYSLEADLTFTGIDPSRLFPDKAARDQGDQAETAGRVILSVPLTPDPETLLQRMGLHADITKIGPRTLERLLYALDPQEQNETIVQQRRLMDIGYPRFVSLDLAYGNLSLSGEVEVKGFRLDLPRIDRLPVGNLALRNQLSKALAPIKTLVNLLDAASAGGICRDPAGPPGKLKVIGNTAQEGAAP